MRSELEERISKYKAMDNGCLQYSDGLENVEKAIEIIEELQKELQEESVAKVYWELCYNKEKVVHEKLKEQLRQFSEENYKQSQKGYYGCNCYSVIDSIIGE